MQNCPNCHAENKEHDVYCYRCGSILPSVKLPNTEETGTTILKQQTERLAMPKRRWGTARLDNEALISLRIRGVEQPLQVYLTDEVVTLGRTVGEVVVEVDLSDHDAVEKGVSRRHAQLALDNDTVTITDLGSANNTYINGQRIIPNEARILRDGDEIRLGRLVMNVRFGELL